MPSPNPTRPYSIPGFRIALVREPGVKLAERPALRTAAECAPILGQYIGETDREVFVVAMLTVRHRLIGVSTVAIGCLTSTVVHPREVVKPLILSGAAAFVACHNHPSGDPEPSAEDVALTRRLASAGQLIGIELLDHIVGTRRHHAAAGPLHRCSVAARALGVVFVGNVVHVIQPMVSRRWANIHPLVTLIGALLGVPYFGILGLLIGPLAISYFFELINMYRDEYVT